MRGTAHLRFDPCPHDPHDIDGRLRDIDPYLFLAWNPVEHRHEVWRRPAPLPPHVAHFGGRRGDAPPSYVLTVQQVQGDPGSLPGSQVLAHLRAIDSHRRRDIMDGLRDIEEAEARREASAAAAASDIAQQTGRELQREAVRMHRTFAMHLRREAM